MEETAKEGERLFLVGSDMVRILRCPLRHVGLYSTI